MVLTEYILLLFYTQYLRIDRQRRRYLIKQERKTIEFAFTQMPCNYFETIQSLLYFIFGYVCIQLFCHSRIVLFQINILLCRFHLNGILSKYILISLKDEKWKLIQYTKIISIYTCMLLTYLYKITFGKYVGQSGDGWFISFLILLFLQV